MRKSLRLIWARELRLRTWKLLNVFVAVVTVANVSLVGTLIAPAMAEAAATGWNYPSSNASITATVTNPANAYSDNGVNAVFSSTADHKYGNFNISIPAGSTVNGIEVAVQGCASSGNDKDLDIYISDNNGSTWGNNEDANNFDTNCDTITLGGSNDKWGRANWTLAELANGTFAVRIHNDFSSGTIGVDYVAVKVHYTAPVGGSGSIWTTNGDCGTSQQDVNHFSVGDHVYINGSNFTPNTSYAWNITGQPGGASNDPSQQVAGGNFTTDGNGDFCFDAYTVLWDDGGEYNVNFATKQDNYGVDEGTLKVVKKLDSDGNGTFESTNPGSFKWGFNGGSVNRAMGSEVDVASGSYAVTENVVDGYHFVGWYVDGEGSCTDPHSTQLPATTNIGKNDTDTVTLCNAKDEVKEPVTINAWKIVCTDESDLPNWGANGGPNVTPTTAQDWVNSHQSCSLVPDWNFQWAPDFEGQPTPDNPGDNTGAAAGAWTTFGTTDANGFTSATIDDVSDMELIWVREVWQNGYIPFTMGPNYDNSNDVSAEMYCHTDVINYDNYDWIAGLEQGQTYNCVAWNVLARQPQGTLVVHKQADTDGDGTYELTVTDTEGGFGWKVEGDDEWSTFGSSKGLTPDTYTVLEKEVSGYHMTGWVYGSPDGDLCGGDIKLNDGNPQVEITDQNETHITFCNQVNGSLGGTKYYDWDRDGETDEGDQVISDWEITLHRLYGEGSSVVGTVQTDANGQYAFTNLEPGNYLVCESLPNGWAPTGAGSWTDKGWCQEAYVGGTYDFHNYLTGAIHGQKFNDLNGNGIRDCELPDFSLTSNELVQITPECEPSMNGWTVFIDENDNGALDQDEPSMDTQFHDGPYFDDNGWYWFEDLQPGAYKVCEVQQNDWNQTYPVNANDNCHTVYVNSEGEGATCFNPLTLRVDLVQNATFGPTCNFGNTFVPVTIITLEKVADETEITAGGNITYTLTWTVSGNTPATNAVITDGIPENTTYVSSDGDYDAVSDTVTWSLGTKNPGETGQVTLTVKSVTPVTDGTLVTNTGTFDTDQTDPVQASANTTLRYTPTTPTVLGETTEPGLSLTKTVSAKTVKPGDVVTYTITVSSTGDGDAENIVVTDTLPDGLAFVDGGGKTMTWTIDALAPGTSQEIEVNVRVENDAVRGEYVNIATATANEVSEVQASATIEVRNPAVLGLATTGSGFLDYAIFLLGAIFLTFGIAGLKQAIPAQLRRRA